VLELSLVGPFRQGVLVASADCVLLDSAIQFARQE